MYLQGWSWMLASGLKNTFMKALNMPLIMGSCAARLHIGMTQTNPPMRAPRWRRF